MTGLRAISYGGGVQSTALLVLAAQKRINYRLFLMANVGDDSEQPETLAYVERIAKPYAAKHGIDLRVLTRTKRDGAPETLFGRMMHDKSYKTVPIPVRLSGDGPPLSRICTVDFKLAVLGKWLKANGAAGDNPATVGLGISLDEIHRANTTKNSEKYRQIVYPLIGIGEDTDLRMRRDDCMTVIREAGLPVPPKSSCYFCPLHTMSAWQDQARERPDLFEKSAQLEEHLTATRAARGKGPVFLSRAGIPLREAINTDQSLLFDDAGCDSGVCFV